MARKFSRKDLSSIRNQAREFKANRIAEKAKNQQESTENCQPELPEGIDLKDERVKKLLKKGFKVDQINPEMLDALDKKPPKKSTIKKQVRGSFDNQKKVVRSSFEEGDLVSIHRYNDVNGKPLTGIVLGLAGTSCRTKNTDFEDITVMTKEGIKYVRSTRLRKLN